MGPVETLPRHGGSDERKHREDLQHELADLRSRFHELQESYNQLEKENQQLKTLRTGGSIAPRSVTEPMLGMFMLSYVSNQLGIAKIKWNIVEHFEGWPATTKVTSRFS